MVEKQKSTKIQKSIRLSPISAAKLDKLVKLYGTQTSAWETALDLLYRKHFGEEVVECTA